MDKSSRMEIQLLGPVEIAYEDKPLEIGRRIERGILYFLAVEHRPVSRKALIDLFWPEADQKDPRATLRTALSRLRNELPDPELIVTELDQVWLDHDRCKVDFISFENAYKDLQSVLAVYPKKRTLPAQIIRQILEVLAFWHGDTFIDGENFSAYSAFENWRQSFDWKLRHHRKLLMNRLADHYLSAGRLESALNLFLRLSQLDILDESIHLSVLSIMIRLGRHKEIIDYCDDLEEVYERDYNTPLPDAVLEKCQQSLVQVNTRIEPALNDWPIPKTMDLQLVGRELELSRLKQAFFHGGMVVVQGEMGVGKTRLVQELFKTLEPKPTIFLAPAREMEINLPLSSIIHGLRRHVPQDIWEEIDTVWARRLCLLLPELTEICTDCNQSTIIKSPYSDQYLFDALQHVFQQLAISFGKLLFFLDDAQWADKQTLQALTYLGSEGFFDQYGVLILAYRPEEPNQELENMVGVFQRSDSVSMIALNDLTPIDLRRLLEQVLDEQPPDSFTEQLFRETNGNPFIALEILRNILDGEDEIDNLESKKSLPLPANVHALIRRRVNHLDADSYQILRCAAVLGNYFSIELLRGVAELEPNSAIDRLEPLVKAGFLFPIQEDHQKRIIINFVHEKIREVVLKESTPLQLQKLHQRTAQIMAKAPQSLEKASIIADHFLSAGEVEQAFYWFKKAATYAWSLGAKEETLQAFQLAENLVENVQHTQFKQEDIFHLYQDWSDFAYQSNQVEMLEDVANKLQHIGRVTQNPLFIGASQVAKANACFLRSEYVQGSELIEEAIGNLENTDNTYALMKALIRRGVLLWWNLDLDSTLRSINRALELGKSLSPDIPDLVSMKINARVIIGMVYYAKGNAKEALVYAQKTYQNYFHTIDPFDQIRVLYMLAYAHLISANVKDAEQSARRALEISKTLGNSFVEEIVLMILSRTKLIQGHLDEAYHYVTTALSLGEKNERLYTIIAANCVLGDLFSVLHNYTKAHHHYRVAQIRDNCGARPLLNSIENKIHLARLLIFMGQLSESQQIITPILEDTKKIGADYQHVQALMVSGLRNLMAGDLVSAEDLFINAGGISKRKGLKYHEIESKTNLVRLSLSRHQFKESEERLNEILDECRSKDLVFHALMAIQLSRRLEKVKNDRTSTNNYRVDYESLMKILNEHTRADVLRSDFLNAKRLWNEGHHYP